MGKPEKEFVMAKSTAVIGERPRQIVASDVRPAPRAHHPPDEPVRPRPSSQALRLSRPVR